LFTEIEFALFVAFINGVPGYKVKEKGTREEKKERERRRKMKC